MQELKKSLCAVVETTTNLQTRLESLERSILKDSQRIGKCKVKFQIYLYIVYSKSKNIQLGFTDKI